MTDQKTGTSLVQLIGGLIIWIGIIYGINSFLCNDSKDSEDSKMTVCDCLKDDGTHKKECDELARSMSEAELSREIAKCK